PRADERRDRRFWVERSDACEERARLQLLVADDLILVAPPELQRRARRGDRPRVRERAPLRVRAGPQLRRPADFQPRELLQASAHRAVPRLPAPLAARAAREGGVLQPELRHGAE